MGWHGNRLANYREACISYPMPRMIALPACDETDAAIARTIWRKRDISSRSQPAMLSRATIQRHNPTVRRHGVNT